MPLNPLSGFRKAAVPQRLKGGEGILNTIFFIFGLVFGSFSNVAGLRIPLGQSIVKPPSHCPNCLRRILAFDLIPVISFVLLKGRCRYCRMKISILYPLVECLTAFLFSYSFYRYGLSIKLILSFAFITLLMMIFVSDLHFLLIPNQILLFFTPILLFLRLSITPLDHWWQPFAGALIGFAIPYAVAVASGGKMGGGDIKLFTVIGIVLGTEGMLAAFFFSTFSAAVVGGLGLAFGKLSKGKPIPFGPYIAAGALASYFFGRVWLKWYLQF